MILKWSNASCSVSSWSSRYLEKLQLFEKLGASMIFDWLMSRCDASSLFSFLFILLLFWHSGGTFGENAGCRQMSWICDVSVTTVWRLFEAFLARHHITLTDVEFSIDWLISSSEPHMHANSIHFNRSNERCRLHLLLLCTLLTTTFIIWFSNSDKKCIQGEIAKWLTSVINHLQSLYILCSWYIVVPSRSFEPTTSSNHGIDAPSDRSRQR